jgi:hypothetical protein
MKTTLIPRKKEPHEVKHSECGKFCKYECDHFNSENVEWCELYDRIMKFDRFSRKWSRLPQCINKEPA